MTISAAYRRFGPRLLIGIALLGLATGGWVWSHGDAAASSLAWTFGTLPVLLALFAQIIASLRRGDVGLDVVAALSMSAALVFGETLAGNVVALMYAGGQLLESFAEGRARREMTALLGRVAFTAMRYRDHTLEEVPIATIRQGGYWFGRVMWFRWMATLPTAPPCSTFRHSPASRSPRA